MDTMDNDDLSLQGGLEVVYDDHGMAAIVSGLDDDTSSMQVTLLEDSFKWEVVDDAEHRLFKRRRGAFENNAFMFDLCFLLSIC